VRGLRKERREVGSKISDEAPGVQELVGIELALDFAH
jgi:hypothetical protein